MSEESYISSSDAESTESSRLRKAVFTDSEPSGEEAEAAVPKFSPNMKPEGFTTLNRFPTACRYCGFAPLRRVDQGDYLCPSCGQMDHDDFTSIRNYLDKKGPQPVITIIRELGIPRKIINDFWNRYGM